MAQVSLHMPSVAPGAAAQFRSPTQSPRLSRPDAVSSPLMGPSRRSQIAFPSYEPVHIGSVPHGSKAPSYTGPPPSRGNDPRIHSPRMVAQSPAPMHRQPLSAHSLQTPMSITPQASARFAVPGGPGVTPPPVGSALGSEEVLVFAPSYTPRRSGQPPPVTNAGNAAPRRPNGGSQPVQPQRAFATNLSPRMGHRDIKLSLVGDSMPLKLDLGDKENGGNPCNRENVIVMEPCKDRENREVLVAKLEAAHEHTAKLTEQNARLAQNQQAFEQASVSQREAHALHERLRMDLDEATRQKKQEEATKQELKMMLQNQQQELQQREARLHREKDDCKALRDRCSGLETQTIELQRSLSAVEKEKKAELYEKDLKIECLMHSKEVQLQEVERLRREEQEQLRNKLMEMECLSHDKDQTLQQMKHEHQKQAATAASENSKLQAKLHECELDLQAARELLRVAGDAGERAKHAEEKDIQRLRQRLQDQKTITESLESQLRRTACATSLISPGEFSRLAKSTEAKNNLSVENARLFSRNAELETEASLCRKENALMRRRLPTEVCAEVYREAAASCAVMEASVAETEAAPEEEPSVRA